MKASRSCKPFNLGTRLAILHSQIAVVILTNPKFYVKTNQEDQLAVVGKGLYQKLSSGEKSEVKDKTEKTTGGLAPAKTRLSLQVERPLLSQQW